jgi:hypothetical protein
VGQWAFGECQGIRQRLRIVTDSNGHTTHVEAEPADIQLAKLAAEAGEAPARMQLYLSRSVTHGPFEEGGSITTSTTVDFKRVESAVMRALEKRDPSFQGKSLVEIGQALNAAATAVAVK